MDHVPEDEPPFRVLRLLKDLQIDDLFTGVRVELGDDEVVRFRSHEGFQARAQALKVRPCAIQLCDGAVQ